MSTTILVTRPEPKNQSLCKVLAAKGFKAIEWPLLMIKVNNHFDHTLLEPDYDIIIFTSRNAVHYFKANHGKDYIKHASVLAIGHGTAEALQQNQITVNIVPDQFNSEGLLALPAMQLVKNKKILLVTGVGGRAHLSHTLMQRGAQLTRADVYLRAAVEHELNPETLNLVDMILMTSCESLDSLMHNTPKDLRSVLLVKPLLVTSPRIQVYAHEQGFKSCLLAEGADDFSVLDKICKGD